MKAIKSIVLSIAIAAPIALSAPQAKASDLCAINGSNYHQFTSTYNLFGDTANTPLRSLSIRQSYKISQSATATPLYYTSVSNGNKVVVAFDVKGFIGGIKVGQRDSMIQYIAAPQGSAYARLLGTCFNGQYYPNGSRSSSMPIYELPSGTQSAIQEARYGVTQETIGNMFR